MIRDTARPTPTRRSSPVGTVVVLFVLCVGLVTWHYLARRHGGISLPESGAFLALRPAQRMLLGTGDWVSDVGRTMMRRNGIIRENESLRARLADVEGENKRLLRYRKENEELRQLLHMRKKPSGTNIPAEVVSLASSEFSQRILLNIGSRQGVRPKDVVYTARGVVGQVIEVSAFSAKVLLLTDRQSGVGAMTARTTARGVVQGPDAATRAKFGEAICKMSYFDFQADVREGDLVVTSGVSEIFPKGLIIGRVLLVEKDKTYSRMTAYVDPAVPFDQISTVYVRVQTEP